MKKIIAAGAAVGTALALYVQKNKGRREKKAAEMPGERRENQRRKKLSAMIEGQKNLEYIDRAWLRSWFIENAGISAEEEVLVIARAYEDVLNSLGYTADIKLERESYLLVKVIERITGRMEADLLINFAAMEPELEEMLRQGGGLLKVTGEGSGKYRYRVNEVEILDRAALKEEVEKSLERRQGSSPGQTERF